MFGRKKINVKVVEEKKEKPVNVKRELTEEELELEKKWKMVYFGSEYNGKYREIAKERLTELGYFERAEVAKNERYEEAKLLAKTAKIEREWGFIALCSPFDSELYDLAQKEKEKLKEKRLNKLRQEVDCLAEELLAGEK